MDNKNEMLPIVDENGNVIGKMRREEAHDGSKKLHPVVHLHVFSPNGDIYLQKRPEWKDIQPGKWYTAVGGHVDANENTSTALNREVKEELGISDFHSVFLGRYIYESDMEKELIHVHKTVYDGKLNPNKKELAGGRFWTTEEIKKNIGKDVFTPNFEHEYIKFFIQ